MAGPPRRELKYGFPRGTLPALRRDLGAMLSPDPHGDAGGCYPVESIYFDSHGHGLVREKLAGWSRRCRLRLRRYGPDSPYRLEIKRREGDLIFKDHVPITPDEAELLLAGLDGQLLSQPRDAADRAALRQFVRARASLSAVPTCVVSYRRAAFFDPTRQLRVTLDSELSAAAGGSFLSVPTQLEPGIAVLEIKFPPSDPLPLWLSRLVEAYRLQPRSVSKFVSAALAIHRPRI